MCQSRKMECILKTWPHDRQKSTVNRKSKWTTNKGLYRRHFLGYLWKESCIDRCENNHSARLLIFLKHISIILRFSELRIFSELLPDVIAFHFFRVNHWKFNTQTLVVTLYLFNFFFITHSHAGVCFSVSIADRSVFWLSRNFAQRHEKNSFFVNHVTSSISDKQYTPLSVRNQGRHATWVINVRTLLWRLCRKKGENADIYTHREHRMLCIPFCFSLAIVNFEFYVCDWISILT